MEITKVKDNYMITKANNLIEASYKLTVNEQKLVLVVASLVQNEDEDFKTYRIGVRDLIDTLKIDSKNAYRELQKITKNLMSKVLTIYLPNKKNPNKMDTLQLNWFSSVRYLGGEGMIEARFDPSLKPFLLNLKKHFTSYRATNVIQLKSSYSIRIYEILKQYQQAGERLLSIEKIKEMLGIDKKQYSRYNNFKQKVILVAYDEINQKTDISFEFDEIKEGRKVEKIKFIIKSKKVCPIEDEKIIKKEQQENELDQQIKFKIDALKSIIEHEISEKEIVSILNSANGDLPKVIEKYYIIKNKKDITNFVGLMIDSIKNDYKELKVQNKEDKTNIKTKFHNFEQRFDKYSPEEFERIALENQKKKFGA